VQSIITLWKLAPIKVLEKKEQPGSYGFIQFKQIRIHIKWKASLIEKINPKESNLEFPQVNLTFHAQRLELGFGRNLKYFPVQIINCFLNLSIL
jgi:hypothetical protein